MLDNTVAQTARGANDGPPFKKHLLAPLVMYMGARLLFYQAWPLQDESFCSQPSSNRGTHSMGVTLAEEGDMGVIHTEPLRYRGTGEVSHLVKPVCITRCCQVIAPHPNLHPAGLVGC